MEYRADIGVFGGSGFYSLEDNVEEIELETPYGKPSDKISLVEIAGKKVAFLPRHGKKTSISSSLNSIQSKYLGNEDAWSQKDNWTNSVRKLKA